MTLLVKVSPSFSAAAEILEKAVRARNFVFVAGDCRVDYEGRASSVLEWGERVVIVKQDGSVLVHRPVGYEPVNWQPSGCLVKAWLEDSGSLVVSASRSQPRENVSVKFRNIFLTVTGTMKDSAEFALHVTEEQMKQAILTAPNLVEEGLKPLQEEKSLGEAGFTDIFAEDNQGHLVVIEIKRHAATKDTVTQLQRYLDTLRKRIPRAIRGIVVAPELSKSAQPLLESLELEFVRLSPEKCFGVLKSRRDMKLSHFLG
jgi:RecB family endonuclease NucS